MSFTNSDYGTSIVSVCMNRLIGKNIHDARMKKNYTQEYVAKQLGISTLAYGNIEGAKNETIKMEQLRQIAAILDTTPEELLKGVNIEVTAPVTNAVVSGNNNVIGIQESVLISLVTIMEKLSNVLENLDKK